MLENFYTEYSELLKAGLSADKALAHFDYLHPITLARLKKIIRLEAQKAKNGTIQAASF